MAYVVVGGRMVKARRLIRAAFLGLLAAGCSFVLSAILFSPSHQKSDTSEWPIEARNILLENFPNGPVTADQWDRLNLLNDKLDFMDSLSEVISSNILSGWWWFLFFAILFFFVLVRKDRRVEHIAVVTFLSPSLLVLGLALFLVSW